MIPVSLSGGVEPGARTGTSVNGQAVVVWRGQDGRVRAWDDWCPHRGMRLSFGFVRENQLTCIYHGWSFGASGQCLSIPAHPAMTPSPKITARSLPVAEALGMIWVGDGAPPGDALVWPVRSITVPAPAAALRGALERSLPPGTEIAETAGDLVTFRGRQFRVLAGIQDRGGGTASAHIVTTGPGASGRKVLAAWAADVRDRLVLKAVTVP
jgi:nitrite reductase/ring-hydroxylating ferredoxin subunit